MGFPNLEEFKGALSRQLQMDKDRQSRMDVEQQIVDELLKDSKFVVPQSLLKKQMDYRLHDAQKHYKSHGMAQDEIVKKLEALNRKHGSRFEVSPLLLLMEKSGQKFYG